MMLLSAVVAVQTAPHTFSVSLPTAKSVAVAGTFNNWNKDVNPLKSSSDGKTWSVSLPLAYGKHQYKFVIDGSQWIPDPKGKSVDDGNGNTNTELFVSPPDYSAVSKPGDSLVTASGLLHMPSDLSRSYDRGQLTFNLRTRAGDVGAAKLLVGDRSTPMKLVGSDDLYSYWSAKSAWSRSSNLSYRFLVDGESYGEFNLVAKEFKPFTVPDWVTGAIIYQIFPDRFANGSLANDPPNIENWDAKPTYGNRYGGDAEGVRANADYLKRLGINTVYFNPVFKSPSNHRYEADDFKMIDSQFGTNAEFAAMAKGLADEGIGIVMDLAFNHSAPGFPAFRDIIEKGEASPTKDWYFVKSYPVTVKENPPYEAWYGFPSMPKLNVMNPATSDYLLSVAPFWKSLAPNLRGLRLDVGNEVDMRFWRKFRDVNKKADKDTWILGEVWGDGNPWLQGDQWDSVMNYPFRDALLRCFVNKTDSVSQLYARLMRNKDSYPPQVQRNLMNFMSTHDTPRFLTLAKGDKETAKLAATLLFTWTGAPSIYYGEEIGMEGGADPDNRRAMRWDLAVDSNEMLAYYKKLAAIRKSHPALTQGDTELVLADDQSDILIYSRKYQSQAVLVAINRSMTSTTVAIPQVVSRNAVDLLSGQAVVRTSNSTTISLRPHSAAIVAAPGVRISGRGFSTAATYSSNSIQSIKGHAN